MNLYKKPKHIFSIIKRTFSLSLSLYEAFLLSSARLSVVTLASAMTLSLLPPSFSFLHHSVSLFSLSFGLHLLSLSRMAEEFLPPLFFSFVSPSLHHPSHFAPLSLFFSLTFDVTISPPLSSPLLLRLLLFPPALSLFFHHVLSCACGRITLLWQEKAFHHPPSLYVLIEGSFLHAREKLPHHYLWPFPTTASPLLSLLHISLLCVCMTSFVITTLLVFTISLLLSCSPFLSHALSKEERRERREKVNI